jgi:predicted HicB family RNase H-like nuclease
MSILKAGRPSSSNKEKALAEIHSPKVQHIRMNVNITKSLHKQIKQRALDEDITVTELIHKAVNEYMSK